MASVDSAPQLSPVRQFAPLDLNSPHRENNIDDTTENMPKVRVTTTLESGAPETPEESRYVFSSCPSLSFPQSIRGSNLSFVVVSDLYPIQPESQPVLKPAFQPALQPTIYTTPPLSN